MEGIPKGPLAKTVENTKSFLIRSEERSKQMTSELSPKAVEAAFTVESYDAFNPNEITPDDQVYVRTESGNVYRLARSESRPNLIKFDNERTKELQYGVPWPGHSNLIEVGKQMFYASLENPDDISKGATGMESSTVKSIELWKNYLKAQKEIKAELQQQYGNKTGGFGAMLAAGLDNTVRGQRTLKDYTIKKEGKKV